MKIVINSLSVFTGGGLTAMINLLPELEKVDRANEYVVLVSVRQAQVIAAVPARFGRHEVQFNPRNLFVRLLYEQLVLPLVLWRLGANWLYSVGNVTTLLAPCRVLLLMENANPYSALDITWSRKERLRQSVLKIVGTFSARRADVVRFLSENSRNILCDKLGIPFSRSRIIPQAVTPPVDRADKSQLAKRLPDKFILTVSNVGPHKNNDTLIEAFQKLVEIHQYPGSLVIAGAKLYLEYYASLQARIDRCHMAQKVIFLDWIDPESLPSLYRQAEIFVFPSAEETFGIPVVEAMNYEVPVVVPLAGRLGSRYFIPYEEICRSAAEYFDVFDSSSLCESMHRVLSDLKRRQEMVATGKEMARRYRWDDVAGALAGVFREANVQVTA